MATSKQQSASPIANLSVRNKLLGAFLIIGLLISMQAFISLNSVDSLSKDFDISLEAAKVKESSLNFAKSQQDEMKFVNDWVIGLNLDDVDPRDENNFGKVFQLTNESLNNLDTALRNLRSNISDADISPSVDMSIGRAIYNENITTYRQQYIDLVNNTVFKTPSNVIMNSMYKLTLEYINLLNNYTNNIINFAFSESERSFNLTDTSIDGNLIAGLTTQLAAINIERDKISTSRFQSLGINESLYREILRITTIDMQENQTNLVSAGETIRDYIINNGNVTSLNNTQSKQFNVFQANMQNQLNLTITSSRKLIRKIETEQSDMRIAISTLNDIVRNLLEATGDLRDWATQIQNDVDSSFLQTSQIQRFIIWAVLISMAIAVVVLVNTINKQITYPVKDITRWSNYIAEGDLSKMLPIKNREDEVGQLQQNFKQMNINLREIIEEVKKSANLISDTSEDLAANTEEINATAEEVSSIAQAMAKGSTEQAEIITTIVEELEDSSQIVEEVSTQITENLAIIKDLSEQTNILALNTAIEAANAGEFGKGFTVIAENIRKMSDQSKRTSQQVSKSSKEVLDQLQQNFSKISEMIENVASVSEETAASAEEVAASAEEMTASMESIAASSSILNEQSSESLEVVNQFKLEEE